MIFVDAHCDTAAVVLDREESLVRNRESVNAEAALGQGKWLQFFAAFAHAKACRGREIVRAVNILDKAITECEAHPEVLRQCFSYADIEEAFAENKMACMLSLESMECLQGSLAMLRTYYRMGVRMGSLTWNYRNELADGVMDGASGGGLTGFGRVVVAEMNRLGMIVDCSHISDPGFWDLIRYSRDPIIASHSNARAICPHPRNLTDEMLKAIADKGGVACLNFWGDMLAGDGKAREADIALMCRHIEHMRDVAGEDAVGMGADFGAIEDELPAGMTGVRDTHKLIEELDRRGNSTGFIEKFAGLNMLRVIKAVIK